MWNYRAAFAGFMLWIATVSPALAVIDCAIIDRLDAIRQQHLLLYSGSDPIANGAALGDLLNGFDAATLSVAIAGHPDPDGRRSILNYVSSAQRAAQVAASGELALLTRGEVSNQRLLTRMGTLLPLLNCEPSEAGKGFTEGESAQAISQISAGTALNMLADLRLYAAAGLAGLLSAVLFVVWRRRQDRLRSRARRFPMNRRVDFSTPAGEFEGRILDLSCGGGKLRHDGTVSFKNGGKLVMHLPEGDAAAFIRWHNDHYAGLQFGKPLRQSVVQNLADESKRDQGKAAVLATLRKNGAV